MNLEQVSEITGTEVFIAEDETNNNNKVYELHFIGSDGKPYGYQICKSHFDKEFNSFTMDYDNLTIEEFFIKYIEDLKLKVEYKIKNNDNK